MKKIGDLNFPLKGKYVAMLAPSFVVDFDYSKIIFQLKQLGFDKVVELTFGAKMINRDYHKNLKKSNGLLIASVCPGIVDLVKNKFPKYSNHLALIDSPMIATAKICKKIYPNHKRVFISPCQYKRLEAEKSSYVDFVICYNELRKTFERYNFSIKNSKESFDKFYNDYTKIYPLAGGLSKTAHLKGILRKGEVKIIDGVLDVSKFLKNPDKQVRFLDATFCRGGCIGGPCIISSLSLVERRKKVLKYMELARKEDIPEMKKGLVKKAEGISFKVKEL